MFIGSFTSGAPASGSFTMLNQSAPASGSSGTFTMLNQSAPAPSSTGTWSLLPTTTQPVYYSYPAGYSYQGGGASAYQTPGIPAEGFELSNYPATRFRGLYGEEFDKGNSPVTSLLKSKNAALLAIAIFGVLLLKEK